MSLCSCALGYASAVSAAIPASGPVLPAIALNGFQTEKQVSRKWGELTPYYPVAPAAAESSRVPHHCNVTFVQVLSRHGARAPTQKDAKAIADLAKKIEAAMISNVKNDTSYFCKLEQKYKFLANYSYSLGVDDLTPFGEQELYNSGAKVAYRYANFIKASGAVPFIRAAGKPRVVVSAEKFAAGFINATGGIDNIPVQVLPEGDGVPPYNPLSNRMCYVATDASPGTNVTDFTGFDKTWIQAIIDRLKQDLKIELEKKEVLELMTLCPYETVAMNTTAEGMKQGGQISPFCYLFHPLEWDNFNYYHTLKKYWFLGPGGKYSAASGAAWVHELLARLTDTPITNPQTINNPLFDRDPATFPLGKKLYADFSHDDNMLSMFSAMGMFDRVLAPTPDVENQSGFVASQVVPFASRLYVEKMQCANENGGNEVVRLVLNDKVKHIGCNGAIEGRCPLNKFVAIMNARLSEAKNADAWSHCMNPPTGKSVESNF